MRIKPREDQRSVTQQVFKTLQQAMSALVVGPTGSGKTIIMGAVTEEEIRRGGKVIVVAPLQVLLGQIVATMVHGFDIETSALHDKITHYIVGQDQYPLVCDYKRKLLVTMPKTLTNTLDVNVTNDLYFDPSFEPTMILLDEAHRATSAEYQKIRNMFPNAKIVGFTATPHREKNETGESLVEWYGDRIIIAATMADLIAAKRLARPVYVNAGHVSETHIAKAWLLATTDHSNKRTIIFTDNTDHSKALEKQFLDLGIKCEVVTAGKGVESDDDYVARQSTETRNAIFKRFYTGETEVLISVNALCEGFDEKRAKFCFLTRKVANIALYQQMCGRVLRWCEDKPEGFIYDFADNLAEHGKVEAIEWPRAAKGLVLNAGEEEMCGKSYNKRQNVWKECGSCGHVYNVKQNTNCKACGKAHNLVLIHAVDEMVTTYLKMNHQQFAVLCSRFRIALSNPTIQNIVNKQANLPIFENGVLNSHYSFIPDVIAAYEMTKIRKGNKTVGNWQGEVRLAA